MTRDIDIWHDDEGVWADAGTGILGPFVDEREAEIAFAVALIKPVADALAQEDAENESAQELAADLNLALHALDYA